MLRQAPNHAPAPAPGGAARRAGGPNAPGPRGSARPDPAPAAPAPSRSDQLSWRNAVLGPTSASPGKDAKGTPDGRPPPDLQGDPAPASPGQGPGAGGAGRGAVQPGPAPRAGGRGPAPAWGKSEPPEAPSAMAGDAPGQTASPDRSSWPLAFSSSRNTQGRRGSGPAWGAPDGLPQAPHGLPVGGPSTGREAQAAPGWGAADGGQAPARAKFSDALKGSLQAKGAGPKTPGPGSAGRQEAWREGGEKVPDTAPGGSVNVGPPMPAGREMFVATLTCMMGHQVEVQLADGRVYRGIFHTANAKAFDVCLKMARLVKQGSQQPGAEKDGIPGASSPIPVLRVDSPDIVRLTAKDLPFLVESEGAPAGRRGAEGDLAVDKSISRGATGVAVTGSMGGIGRRGAPEMAERELQPWRPDGGDSAVDLSLESMSSVGAWGRRWDQFEANKKLFKVETTFDENLYTTRLVRPTAEIERQAERIAREIESQPSRNMHMAEERGLQLAGRAADMDEEARFSSVLRSGDDLDAGEELEVEDAEEDEAAPEWLADAAKGAAPAGQAGAAAPRGGVQGSAAPGRPQGAAEEGQPGAQKDGQKQAPRGSAGGAGQAAAGGEALGAPGAAQGAAGTARGATGGAASTKPRDAAAAAGQAPAETEAPGEAGAGGAPLGLRTQNRKGAVKSPVRRRSPRSGTLDAPAGAGGAAAAASSAASLQALNLDPSTPHLSTDICRDFQEFKQQNRKSREEGREGGGAPELRAIPDPAKDAKSPRSSARSSGQTTPTSMASTRSSPDPSKVPGYTPGAAAGGGGVPAPAAAAASGGERGGSAKGGSEVSKLQAGAASGPVMGGGAQGEAAGARNADAGSPAPPSLTPGSASKPKKSMLNPNAKAFTLNPNARVFTPGMAGGGAAGAGGAGAAGAGMPPLPPPLPADMYNPGMVHPFGTPPLRFLGPDGMLHPYPGYPGAPGGYPGMFIRMPGPPHGVPSMLPGGMDPAGASPMVPGGGGPPMMAMPGGGASPLVAVPLQYPPGHPQGTPPGGPMPPGAMVFTPGGQVRPGMPMGGQGASPAPPQPPLYPGQDNQGGRAPDGSSASSGQPEGNQGPFQGMPQGGFHYVGNEQHQQHQQHQQQQQHQHQHQQHQQQQHQQHQHQHQQHQQHQHQQHQHQQQHQQQQMGQQPHQQQQDMGPAFSPGHMQQMGLLPGMMPGVPGQGVPGNAVPSPFGAGPIPIPLGPGQFPGGAPQQMQAQHMPHQMGGPPHLPMGGVAGSPLSGSPRPP